MSHCGMAGPQMSAKPICAMKVLLVPVPFLEKIMVTMHAVQVQVQVQVQVPHRGST